MKINGTYILRKIAGDTVLVPVGEASLKLNGIISLNPTGELIWTGLEQGKDRAAILADILEEYDVTEEEAAADLDAYLNELKKNGLITD